MSAIRTQVYFTEAQRRRLDALADQKGTTLAHVIREAVDAYVTEAPVPPLDGVLEETFGSMPDLTVPARDEWTRGYG